MNLIDKGVDLDLVRRFLGHASIATTQVYLRARDQDRLGEELAVKDGLFGEVVGEGVSHKSPFEFEEKEHFRTKA